MSDDMRPNSGETGDESGDSEQGEQSSDAAPREASALWRRIASAVGLGLGETRQSQAARLRELTIAIRVYPDAPSNYEFRGELYLEMGLYELAAADFGTALELATRQVDETRWGVAEQVIQDRAARELASVQYMLGMGHHDSTGESQPLAR